MLTSEFLAEFKRETEERWKRNSINPTLYGFQFQQGTRWNPGLNDLKIAEYENSLHLCFSHDFRLFLRNMNGTDLPTINTYASSGEKKQSVGVYSYPRDLDPVRRRILEVQEWRSDLAETLALQGFTLAAEDAVLPVYIHRYLVCAASPSGGAVLSIADRMDAIVFAGSLEEYLRKEFLSFPT